MRGTHDGAGREGSTHITEKWMPVESPVAAISPSASFSIENRKVNLEVVEADTGDGHVTVFSVNY